MKNLISGFRETGDCGSGRIMRMEETMWVKKGENTAQQNTDRDSNGDSRCTKRLIVTAAGASHQTVSTTRHHLTGFGLQN